VSLGLFVATNLLAATSQRRYAIKEGSYEESGFSVVHEKTEIPRVARDDSMNTDDRTNRDNVSSCLPG